RQHFRPAGAEPVITHAAGDYIPGELTVHHDPARITAVSRALRGVGRQVVLVPTMGALHEGHIELVRQAKRVPGSVVIVSIFVNPLQFGEGEDLDAYPRTLDRDVELLRREGVELVLAPSAAAMYPPGRRTMIHPGPLGAELEGAASSTHSVSMLTVTFMLYHIAAPYIVYFGAKDYLQLALIPQTVVDLDIVIKIVVVPTVR